MSPTSTLLKRALTAAVLIPLVVGALLFGSPTTVAVMFGFFVLGGAWEWAGMASWPIWGRLSFVVALLLFMLAWLSGLLSTNFQWLPALSLVWWLLAFLWVLGYQRGRVEDDRFSGAAARTVIGASILVPAWIALLQLNQAPQRGTALLVILFCIIWGADTGAYLVGRRWGRRKLASKVSPGKSWEGVAGGALVVVLVAVVAAWLLELRAGQVVWFMILCAATVPVSVLGDLTESLFKRQSGVKDSGTLLPGHGGVLDRIDSLTAAAPFFAVGAGLIGIG